MKEFLIELRTSAGEALGGVIAFLPKLATAIIILLIGWLIARSLRWAAYKLLRAVKFDDIADTAGINSYLAKGGMKSKASGVIAKLIYWIVMFFVYVIFFNTLGLEVVSNLLTQVIEYIPNIVVACILLVVGAYLAEFVSGMVVGAMKAADFDKPEFIGRIAYIAIMFFTIAIVMSQLGIAESLIRNIVSIILGGLGLAVGIAFGLGGKDWAANLINKNLKM